MPREITLDVQGEQVPLKFEDDVTQDMQDQYIKDFYPNATVDRGLLGSAAVGPFHGLLSATASTIRSAKILADAPSGTPLSNLVDVAASKVDDVARKFRGDSDTQGFKPFNPEWLAFNIGSAAGSFLPGAAAAVTASVLGTPVAGAAVIGGIVGASAEVGNMHEELLREDVDPSVAKAKSLQFGAAVMLLNAGSLGAIARKGGPGLIGAMKRAAIGGSAEAITEALEEPIADAIKGVPWSTDTVKRMAAVAIPSFFVGGAASVAAGNNFTDEAATTPTGDAQLDALGAIEREGSDISASIIPEKRDALLKSLQARGEISPNTMSLQQWDSIINEPLPNGGVPRTKTILARLKAQEATVSTDDFLNLGEVLRVRDDPKVTKKARVLHPDTTLENVLTENGIPFEDAVGNEGFTAEQWVQFRDAFGTTASQPNMMVAFLEQMMGNSLRSTGTSVRQLMNESFGGAVFGKESKVFTRPKDAPELGNLIGFVEQQEVEKFAVPSLMAMIKQNKDLRKELKDSQLEMFLKDRSSVDKVEVVGRLKGLQREGFVRGETVDIQNAQVKAWKEGIRFLLRGMTAQDPTTGVHEVSHFLVLTARGPFKAIIEKQTGKEISKWNEKDHEVFTKGFERYLLNGEFSKGAFENMEMFEYVKDEFKLAYADIKDVMEGMVHEELRVAYDTMLGYDVANDTNGDTFIQDIQEQIEPEPVVTSLQQGPRRTIREQMEEGSTAVWLSDAAGIDTDARLVRSRVDMFKKSRRPLTPGERIKLVMIQQSADRGIDLFPGKSIIEDVNGFEDLMDDVREVNRSSKRQAGLGLLVQKVIKSIEDTAIIMADAGLELSEQEIQLMQEAAELMDTDPGGALRLVQQVQKGKGTKKKSKGAAIAMSIFYQNLLSNPGTHAVNAASNALMINYLAADRVGQAAVDTVWSNITGKARTVYAGEALDVFKAFGRAFTGRDTIANSAFKDSLAGQNQDSDTITKTEEEMGLLINNVVDDFLTGWLGRSGHNLAQIITAPTRYMIAADVWFKAIAEQGQEAAVIRRFNTLPERVAEGEKVKFILQEFQNVRIGDQRLKRVYNTDANTLTNTSESEVRQNIDKFYAIAVKNSASLFAEHATFQDKAGNFTKSLIEARNNFPGGLGRVIIPFVQTQTNIAKRGIELTPVAGVVAKLGGITEQNWNVIATRQVEGAMIASSVFALFASEVITGAAPEDKAKRESFFRRGLQPYSVNVNGTWYSYRRLEPLSFPISLMATIYDQYFNADDDVTRMEKFGQAVAVARDHIIDGTFMSNLESNLGSEPQAKKQLMWMTSSIVPWSGFWRGLRNEFEASRTGQVTIKRNETFMDTFGQNLPPGLPEVMGWTATPRLDAFGQVVARDSSWWREWMPVRFKTQVEDVVENAMAEIQVYPGMPGRNVTVRGERVDMPEDIYTEYLIQYGLKSKERVGKLIEREVYRGANVQRQRKMLQRQLDSIRASELTRAKRKMIQRERGVV